MHTCALDALIHHPQWLRIVATLAALRDGDTLSVSRLRTMIGLPPGGPIIGLRELGHAGYLRRATAEDTGRMTVALTGRGRAALDRYTATLPQLPQRGGRHQGRACALATQTGTPLPRPSASTLRKAGLRSAN